MGRFSYRLTSETKSGGMSSQQHHVSRRGCHRHVSHFQQQGAKWD